MRALLIACAVVVAALLAEGGARLGGVQPAGPTPARFSVEPAGWMRPDPTLGFAPAPGAFTLRYGSGDSVEVRHDASGRRATPTGRGPVLEVHGGSFAYGLGVADDETLVAQLAVRAPDWQVRNRAAPGYGPTQAWAALDESIAANATPALMVIAYAAFQDERVAVVRNWRRSLAASGLGAASLPCARGRRGPPRLLRCSAGYEPSRLAEHLVLADVFDRSADVGHNLVVDSHKVTRNLLVHLHQGAEEAGVTLLLVGLDDDHWTADTLGFCEARGVPTLDAGLPWRDGQWTLPFDATHPNSAAHAVWGAAIAEAVGPAGVRRAR